MSSSVFRDTIINASNRKLPLCICIEDSVYIDRLKADDIIIEMRRFLEEMKNDPEISRCADVYLSVFSEKVKNVTSGFKPISSLNINDLWNDLELRSEKVCLKKCLNETFFDLIKQQRRYEALRQNTYKPVIMLIGSGHTEDSEINEGLYSQIQSDMIVMQPIIVSSPAKSESENYRLFIGDDSEFSSLSTEDLINYFNEIFNSINQMSRSTAGIYEKPIRNTEDRWRELK